MRAAVLRDFNEEFTVEDVELAAPGLGEVLVDLHASGVCHSDWNTVTGATPNPMPCVLGHEGAGVVEAVGSGVTRVVPGDHVVLSWLPACGQCFFCAQGRQTLCPNATGGMLEGALPGGAIRLSLAGRPLHHYSFLSTFAERTIVPELACVKIREDAPFDVAALVGCAVMTGIGAAVNRAEVKPGTVCVVYGAGGVGLSVVQGCRLAGARAIVAVDPLAGKRELAQELGATYTVDPASEDARTLALELTDGRGADYGFVSVGVPGLVREGFQTIRRGGTLVCIGLAAEGTEASLPATELVRHEKVVTGTLYGSCHPHIDMPLVIDLFMEGRLPLDRLVSKTYDLDAINDAFEDMNAGTVARGVIRLA
jgi:S-(hydroxymethyl)glutathione dehydrogenase / alcohol dehydrogenase